MGTGLVFKSLDGGDAGGVEGSIQFLGPRNGLSGNAVRSLAVTPERVYVGTNSGLSVLEKNTNQVSNITYANGTALDEYIHAVAMEGDTLWVGTGSAGIFRVDPSTLVAEPVENPHNGSRFSDPVMDFAFEGSEMFISVNQYGVVQWDRDTGETERYHETARVEEPLYFRMALTSERIWVGTSYDGAIAYDRDTGQSQHYSGGDTLKGINVADVEVFGDDVWFTTDYGLARYDRSDESWHNYQNPETGWPWGGTTAIEMIDGVVFGMSRTNQIAQYHPVDDSWERVHWWHPSRVTPWGTITGCMEYEGKLLFNTGGRKSWFYDPSKERWTEVESELGDPETGPPEILHRDADADEDALWIATQNGLGHFNRNNHTWTTRETYAESVHEQAYNKINDVDLTADSVWAAAMTAAYGHLPYWASGHLAQMDRDTGEWTRWNTTDGLSGENVTEVHPLDDGRVFVGVKNGGIDVVDPESDTVEHVYPDEQREITVYDLAAHGNDVWAATTDGLLQFNTTSLDVSRPGAFQNVPIASLYWANDTLWVGGVENGLHRWDATSGSLESYTTPTGKDIWGYCMVEHEGLLYVGTQWGLDRFDMAREEFLPKYGEASLWMGSEGEPEPGISIGTPSSDETVSKGEPLSVTGEASGPDAAVVEVRAAGSPWTEADGVQTWSASISLEDAPTGTAEIVARLVEDGDVLAQTAREIRVRSAGANESAQQNASNVDLTIRHDPTLKVTRGETAPVLVSVDPIPEGLEATLRVTPPGEETPTVEPLTVAGNGTAAGDLPAFERSGMASYQIRLSWADGSAHLPDVDSEYGTVYPLAVQAISGVASAHIAHVGDDATIAPGSSGTLRLSLQNTGTRSGTFNLTYGGGPVADWLDTAPEQATVEAGSSEAITLEMTVPADVSPGETTLTVDALPLGLGEKRGDDVTIPLTVGEAGEATAADSGEAGGSNPVPASGLAAVLASVVVAAAIVHRRSAKDS